MVAVALAALLITGDNKPMLIVSVWLAVPVPFCAEIVAVNVPCAEGEPEINPVALALKPDGKPDALNVVGELVAVI